MAERDRLIKDYNREGLASVLDGAVDLLKRAATLYRSDRVGATPPIVSTSMQREAELCLAEVEELIAAVRARRQ